MSWRYDDAEAYLGSLEPFGWRFGLDRIRRLTSALGMPQHRFASIHVVGTNGKSSVASMCAALFEAHGVRVGAYLSPHDERWSQRVEIGGAELDPDRFAAAVERVAEAAGPVNRSLADGDAVTEFEVVTAAAFVALASARVEFAVIEAGLGGRLDATNVIPSRLTALTSVGLDHTQWLGDTVEAIAAEKLAVLRGRSTLVVGRLPPSVAALAREVAAERGARLVVADEPERSISLHAPGEYLRRNFAVAEAAVAEAIGGLENGRVREAAAALDLHGRMELLDGEAPLLLDAAHNPDGARALAEALPEAARGRPVVGCLAVLADKDAEGILRELGAGLAGAVCTAIPEAHLARSGRPGTRSVEVAELAGLARAAGIEDVVERPEPGEAAREALALAREHGALVLATGSHYLLGYAERAARESGKIHVAGVGAASSKPADAEER
jgi:dihydrofolate synthase / folylpolyglutamate synthase